MRAGWLLVGGLCCFAAGAQAAGYCQTRWNAQFGENATGVMWATTGEKCTADIYTGFGLIRSVSILSPAQHGVAVANSRSHFSYVSKPGFIGRDGFVVAIDGQSPGGAEGRSTIAFIVVVSR